MMVCHTARRSGVGDCDVLAIQKHLPTLPNNGRSLTKSESDSTRIENKNCNRCHYSLVCPQSRLSGETAFSSATALL
jgi:hypothetical protein